MQARRATFAKAGQGGKMASSFDRVRVLWPDHLGLARGKYIPAEPGGAGRAHCTGTWALAYDRAMTPETRAAHWNEGLPDFDAVYERPIFVRDGRRIPRSWWRTWNERVSLLRSRRATALRRAVADWRALGSSAQVGIELEAYVFVPDGEGGWDPWILPAPSSTARDRR